MRARRRTITISVWRRKVRSLIAMGAAAVQLGTPFAVSEEGDAHPEFKRVLAEAKPEDLVTFMSVAGLPARAVSTPWLAKYLQREKALQSHAKADPRRCVPGLQCLTACGLRDGLANAGHVATSLDTICEPHRVAGTVALAYTHDALPESVKVPLLPSDRNAQSYEPACKVILSTP